MTARGPDWSRTHALVVAVEQYAEGGDWCLDGPARDAANMITWLMGQGVPRENVQLLASPRPENKHLLEAVGLGTYDQVNQTTVRNLFRHRLAALAGDWLWVYWAGHGVQAKGSQWSLLYPEARSNDLIGLDAGDLVDLLQSDRLDPRDFRRVSVVIDACRQPLSVQAQMHAADPDRLLGTTTFQKARQVFAMHACEPGGLAKNRAGEGLFTRVLLDELATEGRSDTGPDLEAVWGRVRDEFERRRDAGTAQQIPTVSVRNWAGDSHEFTFAPLPLLGPDEQQLFLAVTALIDCTPGAAAACGARLAEELGATPTSEDAPTARDLVGQALGTHHGITTLLHVLAESTRGGTSLEDARRGALKTRPGEWLLRSEYDELAELLGENESPLLETFVRAARHELPGLRIDTDTVQTVVDGLEQLLPPRPPSPRQLLRVVERTAAAVPEPGRGALRAWSDRCAERSDTPRDALLTWRTYAEERADAISPAATPFDHRIQIQLSPQTGTDQRRTYQVWSARAGRSATSLVKVDTPSLPAEIRLGLDRLLVENGRVHETLVEFFLPYSDLDLDVHRWGITNGTPLEHPLGVDYPVVVRPADERPNPVVPNHRRRWDRVAASTTHDLHWLPDGLGEEHLYRTLSERASAPGVVMTVPARARPRARMFAVCVYSGIPVLVWHRGEELRTVTSQLKSVLRDGELPSLPHRLREFRCGSDPAADRQGRHLAMLWDDPDLPLPRPLALSAPL
ncbi:caspase family protein [Streptomyces sp. NPDC060366]|uniref:VMAP-C domain-containing protein n=1 Tax=Streptomyces sp. NPDC060366 TaxID=3347105 RepID=UPI00366A0097